MVVLFAYTSYAARLLPALTFVEHPYVIVSLSPATQMPERIGKGEIGGAMQNS